MSRVSGESVDTLPRGYYIGWHPRIIRGCIVFKVEVVNYIPYSRVIRRTSHISAPSLLGTGLPTGKNYPLLSKFYIDVGDTISDDEIHLQI